MNWYSRTKEELIKELDTEEHGLDERRVQERQGIYGPNALEEAKQKGYFKIFLEQFQSPIIYILLGAALIVFALREYADGWIILAVLIINAVIGALQEGKAASALHALRNYVETNATVMRHGVETIIPDHEVVPGDIILLKEGDKTPADARLLEVSSLKLDESALTGESEPVLKHSDIISGENLIISEQKNMVFKGTYVVGGFAKALVVETGAQTHIGSISKQLHSIDAEVPLKKSIKSLSNTIIVIVIIISTFIFVLGLLKGFGVREMFTTVVAIAVSAIPEGLPVVVTLILATGVYRMSKRNALVKKLQAVEALGQAEIIAVDKTGTITYNQMMVQSLYVDDISYEVTGEGYSPHGDILKDGMQVEHMDHPDIILMGKIASLTAVASVAYSEENKEWRRISGDPTEAALLIFSQKVGFTKEDLLREHPLVMEIPFSSELKYHATVNMVDSKPFFFIAAAPESILDQAKRVWINGKALHFTDHEREKFQNAMNGMTAKGLRILGLGMNTQSPKNIDPSALPEICLVGLVGLSDGLRPEVHQAVADAQAAGVRVVMITGDHVETAKAIAAQAHIYKEGDAVITGQDLITMDDKALLQKLSTVSIFARVTPQHKLRIIELFRKQKKIVAMTGDGVNDALSLAAADLGIAMGKGGTEVAKEAADIVLLDDNFGSIVAAIEEGRNIYKTIKKVILYLFSTNIGELLTIIGALFLSYTIPITASQIIWLNFVTDGFLVIALALEPKDASKVSKSIRSAKLLDGLMVQRMLIMGVTMMICSLYVFNLYPESDYLKASTMVLTVLAILQLFNAWNVRSETHSVFSSNPFKNVYLVLAGLIVILLQLAAVYTPFLQKILRTTAISLNEWMIVIGVSLVLVLVEEIRKYFYRRFSKRAL
ncbi:MAG: HAD-IC family P-type ATPase [bacterium]|nr:HAD-IC family P-type ATPase [bacterium]